MIISPKFVALDRVWFLTMRDMISAVVETVVITHSRGHKYKLFNWSGWFEAESLYSTFAEAAKAWRLIYVIVHTIKQNGKLENA